MSKQDQTIANIINFLSVYDKDKRHDSMWLEAQIGNQLAHYREEIIAQAKQAEVAKVSKEKIRRLIHSWLSARLDEVYEGDVDDILTIFRVVREGEKEV